MKSPCKICGKGWDNTLILCNEFYECKNKGNWFCQECLPYIIYDPENKEFAEYYCSKKCAITTRDWLNYNTAGMAEYDFYIMHTKDFKIQTK